MHWGSRNRCFGFQVQMTMPPRNCTSKVSKAWIGSSRTRQNRGAWRSVSPMKAAPRNPQAVDRRGGAVLGCPAAVLECPAAARGCRAAVPECRAAEPECPEWEPECLEWEPECLAVVAAVVVVVLRKPDQSRSAWRGVLLPTRQRD